MPQNVWFISGATSGFGQAIAQEALTRGDAVIATSRKASTSKSAAHLASQGATLLDLDVTASDETRQAAIREAARRQPDGRITHFVNAAGYLLEGPVEGVTEDEVVNAFSANVVGNIMMSRHEVGFLRQQQGGGVIANFGSLGSWEGGAGYAVYGAVKWAVSGFTECLHDEVKEFGISTVVIEPGYFRTGFLNTGGGNRILVGDQMEHVYGPGTAVHETRELLNSANDKQPGDVTKAARLIVDVLTRTGAAERKEIPMRLLLGQDVVDGVRNKLAKTEALIQEWSPAITSLDHDDVRKA